MATDPMVEEAASGHARHAGWSSCWIRGGLGGRPTGYHAIQRDHPTSVSTAYGAPIGELRAAIDARLPDVTKVTGEHIAERPSWDCLACGKPWPCDPAREHMMATMDELQIAMDCWGYLEEAAGDLAPPMPMQEAYDRFIAWTRPQVVNPYAEPAIPADRPEASADWPEGAKTPAQFEFDMLGELARDPESGLEEVGPGVYVARKRGNGGWISGAC